MNDTPRTTRKPAAFLDRFAISLSGLCLVHCLAIPLALIVLPVLGHSLRGSETAFHWVLFGIAAPVSGLALTRGYLRHRRGVALVLGGVGLAIMLLAASALASAAWEESLTIVGVSLLTAAHIINIRIPGRAAAEASAIT